MDTPSKSRNTVIAQVVHGSLRSAGLSVQAIADTSGIPLTTLKRRFAGATPFTLTELGSLADLAGTTPSALLAEAERRNESAVA